MASSNIRAPENDVEYEELFDAASKGNIKRLEAALLPSMSVDALEADPLQGRGALHIAAQAGSVPTIQWLLAHNAKVDLRNSEGETPLHEAAFWAHPEAIKALLGAGANINLPTGDYNFTALHNVLKYKNTVAPQLLETIEFLLDQGLDINAKADDWGSTLIDQAVVLRCVELVEILIDRGARFDNTLHHAVHDYRMVKFLLGRGAKIISIPSKISAIKNAASNSDIEVIQLLISHANDIELDGSRDALNLAATRGRIDVAKLLIDHGFDVNATTEDCFVDCIAGQTPLIAACQSKQPNSQRIAVAKLLIKNGADVNARNKEGTTAAEIILQDDSLREDTDLQQLLVGVDSR